MPKKDYRERIGQFNNKMSYEVYGPAATQQKLNAIANTIGQQPTQEGIWSLPGTLYLLSILGNLRLPLEEGPARRNAVQENSVPFKAEIIATKKNREDKSSDYDFQISPASTIIRADPSIFSSRMEESFPNYQDPSFNQLFFWAEEVHRWSLKLYKLADEMKDASDSVIEKEISTSDKKDTSTQFQKLRQKAIVHSNHLNDQQTILADGNETISLRGTSNETRKTTESISSDDAAQQLKNTFQTFFENNQVQRNQATISDNDYTENFWGGLTILFSDFFNQFGYVSSINQKEGSESTLINHFLKIMEQAFSTNNDNPILFEDKKEETQFDSTHTIDPSISSKTSKDYSHEPRSPLKSFQGHQYHPSNPRNSSSLDQASTLHKQSKNHHVQEFYLSSEKKELPTSLWQLTNNLAEVLGNVVKSIDIFQNLGAEAAVVSERPMTIMEGEQFPVKTVDEVKSPADDSESLQVYKIDEDIKNNRVPVDRYAEPLPSFFYDYELFQKKNETKKVNERLKVFFRRNKIITDTTQDSELPEIAQRWMEEKETETLDRKQLLTYLLLESYGIENVRWGSFVSANQSQNIFLQWRSNTLLQDYKYKAIAEEDKRYDLSAPETLLITAFDEYKKESDQLYAAFMNVTEPIVSKTQELLPIYYEKELFEARDKTEAVNKVLQSFLSRKKVVIEDHSPKKLVEKLQSWVLAKESYESIIKRQRQVAELIRQSYGLPKKQLSPAQNRLTILQWENNNAFLSYSFKEFSKDSENELRGNHSSKSIEEIDINQTIETFLIENDIDLSRSNFNETNIENSSFDEQEKEKIRKKVASLLNEQGIAWVSSEPQQLLKGVTHWLFSNEPIQDQNITEIAEAVLKNRETVFDKKIKQLGNILFDQKEGKSISSETASTLVSDWIVELSKAPVFLEDTREKRDLDLKKATSPWQSIEMKQKVAHFLRANGLLDTEEVTQETLMLAVSQWLDPEENKMHLPSKKVHKLAKVVLEELNFYGGKKGEIISDRDAQKTVFKWLFENVLGESIETHIVRQTTGVPDPYMVTIRYLRSQLEYSPYDTGGLSFDYLDSDEKVDAFAFKRLWRTALEQTLPNYLYEFDLSGQKRRLVSDYEALCQLMGTKLVENKDYYQQIDQSERNMLGALFIDELIKDIERKENTYEALSSLILPALLVSGQLEPDLLREALNKGNEKEVALNTFVSYWEKGYFEIIRKQEEIEEIFQKYQSATLGWRGKSALAKEMIQECYTHGAKLEGNPLVLVNYYGKPPVTETDAINRYLSGGNPCPTAHWELPNLEELYRNRTNRVAETYFDLDRKLIENVLESMDPEESKFLFSTNTQIYEASAKVVKKKYPITISGTKLRLPVHTPVVTKMDKTFSLNATDLIAAKCGEEERIYGLKKLENEGGFAFYRVDQNKSLYVDHQLFGKEVFQLSPDDEFSVHVDYSRDRFARMDSQGLSIQSIFSSRVGICHRRELYDQLYRSGDVKTQEEKALKLLTEVIPFYNCITQSIEKDKKAVLSCALDIVMLIPIAGEAVALSTKFGVRVISALSRGGIRSVLRNTGYFVPTVAELQSLSLTGLRVLEPGFEMAIDGVRLLIKGVTKLGTISRTANTRAILTKLGDLDKARPSISETFIKARLPKNGPIVFVKPIDEKLYVQVSNTNTGSVFGNYFLLKNNELEVFKGRFSFSEKQKRMINRSEVKISDSQKFKDETNSNPELYGQGAVRTLLGPDGSDKLLVQMNDQWVQVRKSPMEGGGMRYDANIGKKFLPINFNGMEWYFEARTSPLVSIKVERKVGGRLNQYESLSDPLGLSKPDEKGLMRNAEGRTYIKVKNHYIPLILLDKIAERYHLVKKNSNQPMTVLRFHPENNQFHFETALEKKTWQEQLMNNEAGQIRKEFQEIEDVRNIKVSSNEGQAGPSNQGEGQAGPSQENPQKRMRLLLQGANTLPLISDKSSDWNAIRRATVSSFETVVREENLSSHPKNLLTFLAPRPIEVLPYAEDSRVKQKIWDIIEGSVTSHPDPEPVIHVCKGLTLKDSPEFLHPFMKQLLKDFDKSRRAFWYLQTRCQKMLRDGGIAATDEGQYLIKMFELESVVNQEPILQEITKRLLSISENGARVLTKTHDFHYENIWIASTELTRNQQTGKFESLLTKRRIPNAFVLPYDPQCRMIILADAFHMNPDVVTDLSKDREVIKSEFESILHETTHIGSNTADLLQFKAPLKGFSKSGSDVLTNYKEKFPTIKDTPAFANFVDRLAEEQNLPTLSKEVVMENTQSDDMLRVNLQIEDAEVVATTIRDFSTNRMRHFDERPRIKRHMDATLSEDQTASMIQNMVIAFLSSPEQYPLSSQIKEAPETEKADESPSRTETTSISTETDEERSNEKRDKREVGLRSAESIFTKIKEQSKVLNEKRKDQKVEMIPNVNR